MIKALAQKIIESQAFIARFTDLQKVACRSRLSFGNDEIHNEDIKKLLLQSSVLALSYDESHRGMAQKINSLLHEKERDDVLMSYGIQILCSRLGNYPVVDVNSLVFGNNNLMRRINEGSDAISTFDPEIIGDIFFEEEKAKLRIGANTYHFNIYQREILNCLAEKSVISFSAPTSFGKSFIVRHHIALQFLTGLLGRALIVVPTKALIDNFYEGMQKLKKDLQLDIEIFTHSRSIPSSNIKSVFILTQERLMFLLDKNPEYVHECDLIYCDEAHYVSRGYRGFLLRKVIRKLIDVCGVKNINGNTQYIFSSPIISNPEYFKNTFFSNMGSDYFYHKKISYSPVEKNIHLIKKSERNATYSLVRDKFGDESVDQRLIEIGTYNYEIDIIGDDELANIKRDVEIVLNMNLTGGTILYATNPLTVHKYAKVLEGRLPSNNELKEEELVDIKRYIRDHYDENFELDKFLIKGIGLHYGPMPIGLRRLMVDLFERKVIKYIICTQTLLEGVNLPAKNMVLFSDTYANRIKHDNLSFNNLIGRAGRITYGLSGNIYCISKENDTYKSLLENGDTVINDPETDVMSNRTKRNYIINSFINPDERYMYIISKTRNDIEYLIYDLLTIDNPTQIVEKLSKKAGVRTEILDAIRSCKENIDIPYDLLIINSGIDPRMQNELYLYLNGLTIEQMLLLFDLFENVLTINSFQIRQLLETTTKYLKWPIENDSKRLTGLAGAITQWLHEVPLSQFIQYRLRFHLEDDYYVKVNAALDTVKNLESELSFNAPKYIKCFFDIMLYISRLKGIEDIDDYIDKVESFLFALESGITSPIGRYLYEKGVSRPIAIKVKSVVSTQPGIPSMPIDAAFFKHAYVVHRLQDGLSGIAFKELYTHLD